MSIRMKGKFYYCLKNLTPTNYDPMAEVERGTHLYKERLKLTKLFMKARQQEEDGEEQHEESYQAYQVAKAALFDQLKKDKNKKSAPTILTMELKHGDIVVMHGHDLQARYEVRTNNVSIITSQDVSIRGDANTQQHAVSPKGKLRYGLTCRHIKPENIPSSEHWKGEFHIKPEDIYDGGPGPVF